jgi:hypothetical protein
MRNRVRNYRFLKRRCLLRIKCVSLFWKEEIFKNNYCLGYYLLARGSKYFLLPKNTTEYFCAFICCFSNYSDKTGQKMAFPDFLWSVVAATFPLHYAKWDRSFFLIKVILLLYKYTTQLFKCFLRKLSLCLLWSQEK